MSLTVTHAKVSAIADDPAASAAGEVLPSDWNAAHTVSIGSLLDGDGSQVLVTKNTNVDNADNGDFRISANTYDVNPISGRWNQVYRFGYNMNENGIGYVAGEPSMGLHWESFYEQGGAELLEWHQSVFKHTDNTEVRFESWTINRSTYEISKYTRLTGWTWNTHDGTELVDMLWGGADFTIEFPSTHNTYWRFKKNDAPFMQQRNAADSAYLNLPYFGSDNRLTVGYAASIVGLTPTTGTYANSFLAVQPTSGVAGGRAIDIPAPTITGDYWPLYAAGSASSIFGLYIYNANNTSGSARTEVYLLARETYGDPQVTFDINGAVKWSIGADNSDSDAFKLSRDGAIGTNDALRVDSSNNARFYGNLGIANATNGQACEIKTLTELLTIAAAATSTTTIQMPANSIILAVPVRVTTAVTCTSTFTVGDAGSATRFSTAAVSKAVNSTDKGTAAGAYYNATARGIVITPDTTPSDATGRVRVTIYYIECTPPTS